MLIGLHDREIDGLQIKANQEQRRQQRVRGHCTVSGQLRHELLSLGVLNLESVSFFARHPPPGSSTHHFLLSGALLHSPDTHTPKDIVSTQR